MIGGSRATYDDVMLRCLYYQWPRSGDLNVIVASDTDCVSPTLELRAQCPLSAELKGFSFSGMTQRVTLWSLAIAVSLGDFILML